MKGYAWTNLIWWRRSSLFFLLSGLRKSSIISSVMSPKKWADLNMDDDDDERWLLALLLLVDVDEAPTDTSLQWSDMLSFIADEAAAFARLFMLSSFLECFFLFLSNKESSYLINYCAQIIMKENAICGRQFCVACTEDEMFVDYCVH